MERETLREYLSSKYEGWKSFLDNIIFPIFGKKDFEDGFETELLENYPEYQRLAELTGIESIKLIGSFYVGVQQLQIFDVTVSDSVKMERNRVSIQHLIRTVMDYFSCAFMIFHYEDVTRWDWRFTYCSKRGNKNEMTDSKRYTFLLGPNQSCRTATDNFIALYEKHGTIEISDIEQAFNVEALSKEFFNKYKLHYAAFVNYMIDPENGMRDNFKDTNFDHNGLTKEKIKKREEKPIRDYVKKLLGRIVFLHFLQKKGWLGVPEGEEWGKGDRDFMLHLFENANDEQKDDFLDKILEPLFSEALDTDRFGDNDKFDTGVNGFHSIRIPYLNGGLFEMDSLDAKQSRFPAEYFANLLTMLSQYNFTIDENDPNDAEVGVDPEMLGRIFENLLEDNKDKGAFYTPKEIVQYMCRESLIAYLQTDYEEKDKDNIRQFVLTHNVDLLGELKSKIDKKLQDVKICDPAIGSGAFPMGLLRELYFCRSVIEPNIVEKSAEIKRQIIQNNIYGVDIERGAVEIARLRFWLSLIVDETSPVTLPNLDFKIMQGNSLLESYQGIDLSEIAKLKKTKQNLFFDDDEYNNALIFEHIKKYFDKDDHDERMSLRNKIDKAVKGLIIANGISDEKKVNDLDVQNNNQFFLWHTWFNDVFSRPTKEGFDIVIGNPPYISAPNQIASFELCEQRKRIINSGKYKSLNEKWDLYVPFMEMGLQMLCSKGIFSMIVPYPLTNQKYAKKLRKIMTEQYQLLEIVDLSGTQIFDNATVTNCIPFVRCCPPSGELRITSISNNGNIQERFKKLPDKLKQDEKGYVWNLSSENRIVNRYPNLHVLGDFCYISVGMVLNADEKEAKGLFKKSDLISEHYDKIHSRKYIEAKDIDNYFVKRIRYLEWNTERCPNKLRRPTFKEFYTCPKILINSIGTINVILDLNEHYLHNHSVSGAVLWKDLKGVKNKSISTSVKKYCNFNRDTLEILSEKVNLNFLFGILISSMTKVLLADQRGGAMNIYPEHIRNIPIPIASNDEQKLVGDIAQMIMKRRANKEEYTDLLQQLDEIVSRLYS